MAHASMPSVKTKIFKKKKNSTQLFFVCVQNEENRIKENKNKQGKNKKK